MKKKAVVTGASSGIGREICSRLLSSGFSVVGISRSIEDNEFTSEDFRAIQADLSDEHSTQKVCDLLKDESLYILVNCAGVGRFEPHEELSAKSIKEMTFLNLTSAMLLSNALLRSLRSNEGYLININSIEAIKASKFAGVYSATKAGLRAFGESLFEETRKSGLSVTNINPDMTKTPFYDELRFDVSEKEQERLLVTDIADALNHILSMRKGAVVSEYTIRSLNFGISKKKAPRS